MLVSRTFVGHQLSIVFNLMMLSLFFFVLLLAPLIPCYFPANFVRPFGSCSVHGIHVSPTKQGRIGNFFSSGA